MQIIQFKNTLLWVSEFSFAAKEQWSNAVYLFDIHCKRKITERKTLKKGFIVQNFQTSHCIQL